MIVIQMIGMGSQMNNKLWPQYPELWIMHEKILLLPKADPKRATCLYMLGKLCFECYKNSEVLEELIQAVCAYSGALRDGMTDPTLLTDLESALHCRFIRLGDPHDMNTSGQILEDAVRLMPGSNPDQPSELCDLGNSLRSRFEQHGNRSDIDRSILMLEKAEQLTPEGHPERPWILKSLGQSLWCRFERVGNTIDIEKSVSMFEEALQLTPDGHPKKPGWLHSLGMILMCRFEQLGNLHDIKRSISLLETSMQMTADNPHKLYRLTALGSALYHRFEHLGDLDDLNQSILIFQDIFQLTPDGDPQKPIRASNLSNCLTARFQQRGDQQDIDDSVSVLEAMLQVTEPSHPDRPSMLSSLGNTLSLRFQRFGRSDDLNRSISTLEKAAQLTPNDHPAKASRLNNFGNSLLHRFEQLGNNCDIDRSIILFTDAVRMIPESHPEKPGLLNNFASALSRRFKHFGDIADINQSVEAFTDSVRLTPEGHISVPSRLANFGTSLRTRFLEFGDLSDLHKSVETLKQAVRLTADTHPSKPSMFSDLGNALHSRFERLRDIGDLNGAVSALIDAFKLAPVGHTHRLKIMGNLGNSLRARFEQLGDTWDITRSILMLRGALQLTPEGHPERPLWLNNLGASLSSRFEVLGEINNHFTPDLSKNLEFLGEISDIQESVSVCREATYLTPDSHPIKPLMLANLGNSLLLRFGHSKESQDFEDFIAQFAAAARSTSGPASVRFRACSTWAENAQTAQHPSLLSAYSVALDLLSEMAWLGLSIRDRHHIISRGGKLVRDAAAAAISASKYDKAVEWLEQGRSIIWGQLLALRTPVDSLKESHLDLATEFMRLSTQLEGAAVRDTSEEVKDHSTRLLAQQSLQATAQKFHGYAHERNQLLQKIRKLNGFNRFLLPKEMAELSLASKGGPVIILNVSKIRSDALIVMSGAINGVRSVPLPTVTNEWVQSLAESLTTLLGENGRNDRLLGHREGEIPPETQFAHILSELWLRIGWPVLQGLGNTAPSRDNPRRIWWCPTGPLAFLPIHAAGLYGGDDVFGSKMSDFVVSSYTPSLTTLIKGLHTGSEPHKVRQLLVVAQPSAIGQNYIPGTQEEIAGIEILAKGKLSVVRLEEDSATVNSVQKGMKESHWVHFACHGVQNVSTPTDSALLLAGRSRLTLSSIIKLSIPHADLAFLSACQTATGTTDLQEESVHLAAGMLTAGYRGVIATMWSINDNDAPGVAADVYEHLFKTSPPDSTRAAEALHLAVRKLREDSDGKKSFFHWVPFIHLGV
ncbi:CHAT domain-containing protein [Mycena rebaudengoi]|nr:CHAT domain-containing protein [Mycena rebaudengoi]